MEIVLATKTDLERERSEPTTTFETGFRSIFFDGWPAFERHYGRPKGVVNTETGIFWERFHNGELAAVGVETVFNLQFNDVCFPRPSEPQGLPMDAKRVTIKDIAKTAKVSKSTVSRVLNNSSTVKENKRKAVVKAMKKLDFKPNVFARSLAGGLSMTIGIVTQNIGSPFYDSITQGILNGLADSDYSPIFADGRWLPEVEQAAITTLLNRQVDGIILVGGCTEQRELNALRERKPTVVVGRHLDDWGPQCIAFDNETAAYEAVKYLTNAGHRRIAHIKGIRSHEDTTSRLAGYRRALADAGIDFEPELVLEGNFNGQSGVLAIESLITRGAHFSAVFAANDEMAFGARLALFRRGIRVPDDVSLIGFDDQPNSMYMTPPLTTVRQPALDMGLAAARALLNLLAGEPIPPLSLPTQLVIRESVAHRR